MRWRLLALYGLPLVAVLLLLAALLPLFQKPYVDYVEGSPGWVARRILWEHRRTGNWPLDEEALGKELGEKAPTYSFRLKATEDGTLYQIRSKGRSEIWSLAIGQDPVRVRVD